MENAISRKLMFVVALLFAITIASANVFAGNHENKDKDNKIDNDKMVMICHATSADNKIENPFQPYVDETINENAAKNGHGKIHLGPIWFEGIQGNWGDIIPPFDGFAGLNWTAHGQLIWNNNCVWVPAPVDVTEANVLASVACSADEAFIEVTFTNTGDADGSALLNGETVNVPVGATVVETLALNTAVVVEIDGTTTNHGTIASCGQVLGDQTPQGGVEAGLGAVSLAVSSLLGLGGSAGALGYGVVRLRKQL